MLHLLHSDSSGYSFWQHLPSSLWFYSTMKAPRKQEEKAYARRFRLGARARKGHKGRRAHSTTTSTTTAASNSDVGLRHCYDVPYGGVVVDQHLHETTSVFDTAAVVTEVSFWIILSN